MQVYHLPPQAFEESVCFCVASKDGEELLVIPQGCTDVPPRFDGFVYLPWSNDAIAGAPISPKTLICEALAELFPQNPVIISSQICGGTLQKRLEDALERFGNRVFFLIEPLRHLLPLPCFDADPQKISEEEGENIRRTFEIFYTDVFCCNYCVDTNAKCVHLFDTEQSVDQKIKVAESLGIKQILCIPT